MITKAVKLWLGAGPRVVIPVSQFDTMWAFQFSIVNDSTAWTIPTGAVATMNGVKPDGNVFAFAGTIANNKVTVNCDVQMTACAGETECELSFTSGGKTIGTANFTLLVEAAPKSPDDVSSESTLPVYADMLQQMENTAVVRFPSIIKAALLNCFKKVAWVDAHGQDYYDNLFAALYGGEVVSISAVFDSGSTRIYSTDTLDSLKQYLTVTAYLESDTTVTLDDEDYELSGTLTVGTSTITVSFSDKTTTFNVTVYKLYQYVEYIENPSDTNSWIELNVIPSNTFGYKAVVSLAERTGDIFVFGTRETTNGRMTVGINSSTQKPYIGWGATTSFTSSAPAISWGGQFTVKTNYKNDRKAYINTTDVVGSDLSALGFTPTWKWVVLGTRTTNGYGGKQQKLYSLEITDGSSVVMDLKPCYRTSDNAIGLYDEVNNVFYGNSGTGSLAKGADVIG